jgi:hypothetical protein
LLPIVLVGIEAVWLKNSSMPGATSPTDRHRSASYEGTTKLKEA